MVVAKRSVWPGLCREGQQWVQALGNRLRRQKKNTGQTHGEGASAVPDAAVSALSRRGAGTTNRVEPGGRLGLGWPSALQVEKPERAAVQVQQQGFTSEPFPATPAVRDAGTEARRRQLPCSNHSQVSGKAGVAANSLPPSQVI